MLLALPPVLNLPYVWFDLLRMTCGSCLRRRRKKPRQAAAEEGSTTAEGLSAAALPAWPTRHVLVDEQADVQVHGFDGRSLVETYLARETELESQTLPARAIVAQRTMEEARRASSLFFCEARSGFEKLQTVAEKTAEHRELKADPQNDDQTDRIKRIEVMMDKVMRALNIQETVAEVAPVATARRRRRRNPLGYMDGSVHASSSVHAPLVGIWNLGQNAANLAQNAAIGAATAASDFYQQGLCSGGARSPGIA